MRISRFAVYLFWVWLVVLVILNVVPLKIDVSQSLSSTKTYRFRLDYLTHLVMILGSAWIWVFVKLQNLNWFTAHETLKYSLAVICASIGLELMQLLIPWRSFNLIDMGYNLAGSLITVSIISIGKRTT